MSSFPTNTTSAFTLLIALIAPLIFASGALSPPIASKIILILFPPLGFLYSNFIFNISILLLFIKKIKYFCFLCFVFCYNSVKNDYEMTPTVMLKFYLMSFDWNKK